MLYSEGDDGGGGQARRKHMFFNISTINISDVVRNVSIMVWPCWGGARPSCSHICD